MAEQENLPENTFPLDRLSGLSDGVIAIALTLLVLAIDIPAEHNFSRDGLKSFLIQLEPSIVAYISSFIIVAIYWMQHRAIFGTLKAANRILLWLNLLFLFAISLAPFVSKLKTLYRFDIDIVVIFSIMHIFSGMILLTMWRYVVKHTELQRKTFNTAKTKNITLSILIVPIVCIVAFLVSLADIHLGTYTYAIVPIIYIFRKQLDD